MKNVYRLLLTSLSLLVISQLSLAQTPEFYNGNTGSSCNSFPLNTTSSNKVQWIYGPNLFYSGGTGSGNPAYQGNIVTVYFRLCSASSGAVYSNFEISLGQTVGTQSSWSSGTYQTNLTSVFYQSSFSLTGATSNSWYAIPLQTPFPYDPTLSLVFEMKVSGGTGNTVSQYYWSGNERIWGGYSSSSGSYGGGLIDFGLDLVQPSTARNDAGVLSIDSPTVFCDGSKNVVATIKNFGINQVDSVTVNWAFNGITQTPVVYQQLLDTFKGASPQTAQVVLGSKTFTANQTDKIVAWTTLPNNKVDTSNSNDTASADVRPSIYGNFTIDPSGSGSSNYVTFADAVKDLVDFGVCGPVTFEVAAGTYNEQIDIAEIAGASSINTISFFPEPSGTVVLSYNSSTSNNYIVSLSGADWVSFSDMTIEAGSSASYGSVINISGESTNNSFTNCVLNGKSVSSTSNYYAVIYCYQSAGNNGNRFINNEINDGSIGFYMYTGSSTSTNDNVEFIGNQIWNPYYMGAYIYGTTDLIFNENTVRSNTSYTSFYGVYSYYSYNESQFVGNKIHGHYYGTLLYYYNGTAKKQPLIANNWMVGENANYYSYAGLYYYGGFARIVHNTIYRSSPSSYGYYGALIGGGANTFMNNILYSPSGSSTYYTYYANGTFAIGESDYNCFYTTSQFGYFNGIIASFNDWKTTTGFDQNSIYTDPGYTDYDSLRTCNDTIDAAGTPLSYANWDIDNDDRDVMHPDIGADEWIGSDSGAYSAGPDKLVCDGKTAMIGLKVTGGTFLWSTNDTTSVIEVNSEGTYTVTMTTVCGGSHMDEVVVTDATPVAAFSSEISYRTGKFTNASQKGNSYRWVVEAIPPDTFWSEDLTYVFPDNGPYQVCLTVYNDCDTVEICSTWVTSVGIDENELDNAISLRPNPVSDVLTIQFSDLKSDNIGVEMSNIQGQRIYRENFVNVAGNSRRTIDVSTLKNGMYILKFVADGNMIVKRIVVQ